MPCLQHFFRLDKVSWVLPLVNYKVPPWPKIKRRHWLSALVYTATISFWYSYILIPSFLLQRLADGGTPYTTHTMAV